MSNKNKYGRSKERLLLYMRHIVSGVVGIMWKYMILIGGYNDLKILVLNIVQN